MNFRSIGIHFLATTFAECTPVVMSGFNRAGRGRGGGRTKMGASSTVLWPTDLCALCSPLCNWIVLCEPVIKPPFKSGGNPQMQDEAWAILSTAIKTIFDKQQSKLSFEVLYRNAYNLVLWKHGEFLHSNIRNTILCHLQVQAELIAGQNADEFMPALQRQWKDFKLAIQLIRDVCMYLDRSWVAKQVGGTVKEVFEMGLELFQDNIVRDQRICGRMLSTMLEYIRKERGGAIVPRDIAKTVVDMMCDISLTLYQQDFEAAFLRSSEVYYEAFSQNLFASESTTGYLIQVESRLREECDRVEHYLHESSMEKIVRVVQRCTIVSRMVELFQREDGLVHLMLNDRFDDLHRAYRLVKPEAVRGGINLLCQTFSGQVIQHGTAVVKDATTKADPIAHIDNLLHFKRKYNRIVTEAFQSDSMFQNSMDAGLVKVLNIDNSTTKLLVEYVDALLKKGGVPNPPEDDAVESLLMDVITFYTYIKDKDIFNQYYKRALATRLLNERSKSEALEYFFVTKIKVQCGASHTRQVEVMLQDVTVSRHLRDRFEKYRQASAIALPSVNVRILSEMVWPSYKKEQIDVIPSELVHTLESVSAFYEKFKSATSSGNSTTNVKHSVTRLTWLHAFGRAELQPRYGRFCKTRPLKMECNIFQASILLLFNGRNELSLEEIGRSLGVELNFLKKQIMSLCLGKHKALRKSNEKNRTVALGETFRPNDKLSAEIVDRRTKKARARISFPVPKLTQNEKDEEKVVLNIEVQEERKHAIEASIVRTMKTAKKMKLQQLVADVVTQLNYLFKVDPKYVRRRINDLTDREFIARDENDASCLSYIA
eukprot:SAG31_NODE_875_length_11316_cov_8.924044_2_plen_826_part_00